MTQPPPKPTSPKTYGISAFIILELVIILLSAALFGILVFLGIKITFLLAVMIVSTALCQLLVVMFAATMGSRRP